MLQYQTTFYTKGGNSMISDLEKEFIEELLKAKKKKK